MKTMFQPDGQVHEYRYVTNSRVARIVLSAVILGGGAFLEDDFESTSFIPYFVSWLSQIPEISSGAWLVNGR